MPVQVDADSGSSERRSSVKASRRNATAEFSGQERRCIHIGLVNNMAAAAFPATERQFVSLLESASEGIPIRLSLYTLSGIPRAEIVGKQTPARYENVETLWDKQLDGLIVTGREPLTADLRDEAYWDSFTQVLEWARENTYSTVWSCLAAHAAILHMDGIRRRRSANKHFGIFDCGRISQHALTSGLAARYSIPHSRWNGVAEEDLTTNGYTVLGRTADADVDTFVKEEESLFVFFQGHPEYESDTLLREYRRDVGRYLRSEAENYPLLPRNYFDPKTEDDLNSLQEKAIANRGEGFVPGVAAALESILIKNTWHGTASLLYKNWLETIYARKNARVADSRANVA